MNTLSQQSSSFINHGGVPVTAAAALLTLQASTRTYSQWQIKPHTLNHFPLLPTNSTYQHRESDLQRTTSTSWTYLTNNTNHNCVWWRFVSSLPRCLFVSLIVQTQPCACATQPFNYFFVPIVSLWIPSFVVVPCTKYVNCAPRKNASATISL